MKRLLAGLVALMQGANGVAMLVAGGWWYGAVPGVMLSGPYNAHFVKDIGAAHLVAAGGLAWWSLKPATGRGALVTGAAFLALHALIHVADAAVNGHPGHDLVRDFAGVFAPALVAVWLLLPARPSPGALRHLD
ncbi:MAG: hypothetical protein ACHP9T_16045 [Caulobacterales bacterium]|jgi:hypothetical protein